MGGSEAYFKMTDSVCIAALLSGILGSMGFGGGSVLIIYLTLFLSVEQKAAQGINIIFFIPCAVISVLCNLKNHLVKLRTALFLILGGVCGVLLGSFVFSRLDSELLGKIFGGFIVIMGIVTLFSKSGAKKKQTTAE